MLLGRLIPLSFSDYQGRRLAARHEFRRVAPVAAKREKGKETVVDRLLPFWIMEFFVVWCRR